MTVEHFAKKAGTLINMICGEKMSENYHLVFVYDFLSGSITDGRDGFDPDSEASKKRLREGLDYNEFIGYDNSIFVTEQVTDAMVSHLETLGSDQADNILY